MPTFVIFVKLFQTPDIMEKPFPLLFKSLIGIAVLSLMLSAAVFFYDSQSSIFRMFFDLAVAVLLLTFVGLFLLIILNYTKYKNQTEELKKENKELENKLKLYSDAEQKYRTKLLIHEEIMAMIKHHQFCCQGQEAAGDGTGEEHPETILKTPDRD